MGDIAYSGNLSS